ncbi:MAG: endo-cleaving rubber dioxygenase, partial [Solirubrobacteraceae bacterium]|nr:endo-cleaving rubber dioxygenase [Solirubrobacteraceae bacterium]
MTEMSRRRFIGAGAALGAGLYVPGWSWAGAQSVAGIGGATPPWQVWDDEADPIIAAVIDRGEVAAVNALLRGWTKNAQPLPAG